MIPQEDQVDSARLAPESESVALVRIPSSPPEQTPTPLPVEDQSKLHAWIDASGFLFQKVNVRPWGTYELSVSIDKGQTWAAFSQRSFGWGYTEKDAFEILLTELRGQNTFHGQVRAWMGDKLFDEFLSIELVAHNVNN